MVLRSRREYLEAIRNRYRNAVRKDKSIILDEFCATCGYNRKYAIRLLRKKPLSSTKRKPGPAFRYDKELLLVPLKRIWFATDQMCSKKLKAAIPLWLPFYQEEYEPLPLDVRQKLLYELCHDRSPAQAITGNLQERAMLYQARNASQEPDPYQDSQLGCNQTQLL